MVTSYIPSRKFHKLLTIAFILVFLFTAKTLTQTNTVPLLKLSKPALEFYHSGLDSDNYGIKRSLIYYAGKYRIEGVSEHLVEILKDTKDENLCEMLVWSIYQIGDKSCCQDLKKMLETHPVMKVREQIKFLSIIKEYENELIVNRGNLK